MAFTYTNSLERNYDDKNFKVRKITFDIGRYGECRKTILFDELVTEKTAIEAIEQYLSEPMTEDYYNVLFLAGDLFCGGDRWEVSKSWMKVRGDCLGDCKFLEDIDPIDGKEHFEIWCGS